MRQRLLVLAKPPPTSHRALWNHFSDGHAYCTCPSGCETNFHLSRTMEQERLKARRPSVVPQSWRHGWNWAQDNAVKRSVIVGQVGCEYNEIFCVFVSGCVQALNTWSPLCASFFLSFSLSLSLGLIIATHRTRPVCHPFTWGFPWDRNRQDRRVETWARGPWPSKENCPHDSN